MTDSIPRAPGIYKITCAANKRIYIGSAVNLHHRKEDHFRELRRNTHRNPKMQYAWNKYGEDVFIFEVLELVLLPELLTMREQYFFDTLKPFGNKGFNIASLAGSNLGQKRSPEARERMRQSQLGKKASPESIEKRRQALLGRSRSPEIGQKIKQSRIANGSYKHTPESNEKNRQAHLGKKYSPEVRAKVSNAHIGLPRSPEHREKLRQANLGKKLSPEHRAKLSKSHAGKTPYNLGKKLIAGKFVSPLDEAM